MITKILNAIRRKRTTSENQDQIKVYVTNGGRLYVKGNELAQSPAWRAKVKGLIDADLTGQQEREGVN